MNYLMSASFWEVVKNNALVIILLVALVVMLVMSYVSTKKNTEARNQMTNKLEKGVKVITQSGIYGTIESITETTDGKVVVISTGEGDKKSYMQIHINAIANVDNKRNIVLDENGVDITFKDEDESLKKDKKQTIEQQAKEIESDSSNTNELASKKKTTKKVQGAKAHKDATTTSVRSSAKKNNK